MAQKYYHSFAINGELVINAGAYTANTCLADETVIDLLGGNSSSGRRPVSGYIDQLILVDAGNQSAEIEAFIFDAALAAAFDKGDAFLPTAADQLRMPYVATLAAADYLDLNSISSYRELSTGVRFYTVDGYLRLYFAPTGTPTFGATDAISWALYGLMDA